MLSWIPEPRESLQMPAHILPRGRTCVPTCAARSTLGYGLSSSLSLRPGFRRLHSLREPPARGRPGSAVHGSGHVCPGAALDQHCSLWFFPHFSSIPPSQYQIILLGRGSPVKNITKHPHTCQTTLSRTAGGTLLN